MKIPKKFRRSLVTPARALLLLAIVGGVIAIPRLVQAAQTPLVDVVLRIASDGSSPFDATTYDVTTGANGGTDANGTNRVVRVLDTMRYRAEVNVNGTDQTNVTLRLTVDPDQQWQTLPDECLTSTTKPGINPSSTIQDLASPGDKRVLVCNVGDKPQGTELAIEPTAKVKGTALNATVSDNTLCNAVPTANTLDTTGGCVSTFATAISDTAATATSNYVSTLVTASFKIDMVKEVDINPVTGFYTPVATRKAGPGALGLGNGQVVEWVVHADAQVGSERIKGDVNGKRTFTLTDAFIDNNPNNNVGTSDGSSHANRSSNARLYSWDPNMSPCQEIGNAVTNITCTQAGGDGSNPNDSGAPITITLNDVDLSYPDKPGQIFYFKLRVWVPIAEAAAPNDHDIQSNTTQCNAGTCSVTLRNGIVGLDTPNPAIDGASPVITSFTGQQNYGGAGEPGGELTPVYSNANPIGSGNNNFDAPFTDGVGDDMIASKAFYGNFFNGGAGVGTKTIARGQVAPTGLTLIINKNSAQGDYGVCDPIDTSQFTFTGAPADGVSHDLPQYQASGAGGLFERYNQTLIATGPLGTAKYFWDSNPSLDITNQSNVASDAQIVPASFLASGAIRLEYTDLAHSNVLDDMRNFNCVDDIDGNSTNDWVSDYTSLPGGAASVTAVRLVWKDTNWDDIKNVYTHPTADHDAINGMYITAVYDLQVKPASAGYNCPNCSPVGNYLADFGIWQATSGGFTNQIRAIPTTADPNDVNFSREAGVADRMRIVGAKTGIQMELVDPSKKIINAGDQVTYRVSPNLFGTSTPKLLTSTFAYPATPTTLDFVSAQVDPACSTTNGTYGTFTQVPGGLQVQISNVTAGPLVCPYLVTLQAPAGAPSGNYVAAANVVTDDAIINTDSQNQETGQPPLAGMSVQILAVNGYQVIKSNDRDNYEPNEAIPQELTYSNTGSENYSAGNFIDVLPYNGDNGGFTSREDTLTPDASRGSQYTNNDGGANPSSVGLASIPTGANGEVFSYTTANPSTIPIDPCHSDNQPLGYVPAPGDYCYQIYLDNGNAFVDGASAGTGLINWSTTAPADLHDVTAVRWTSTPHAANQPARTVSLALAPLNNQEGDIYCNNFGGRIPEIALDIVSNDICERVVAGTVSGTIFSDNNANGGNFAANPGDGTYANIQVQLLDGAGNPYDRDPVTPGVQTYIVTTGSNGQYSFSGLPSGSYQTLVLNPPSPDQSYDLDDPSPPIPAVFSTPNNSGTFSLTGPATDPQLPDVSNQTQVDFGYTGTASLAGKVWLDTNHNGQQDPGEQFVSGVAVHLLDGSSNPVTNPSTSQPWVISTDSNGDFLFDPLTPGTYRLSFTLPAGMACTVQNQGAGATDSDGAPNAPGCLTNAIQLLAGQQVINEDLGLVNAPVAPLSPNTGFSRIIAFAIVPTIILAVAAFVTYISIKRLQKERS